MNEPLIGTASRPIIAVTGSAGKTTVKAMVASVLKQRWHIFESEDVKNTAGNTLLHKDIITDEYNAAVLEFGMSYYGHIAKHCLSIRPNVSIITNIGTAHIGHFKGSVEELAKAKSELIEGMVKDGILVINGSDANSRLLHTDGFRGTIVKAGILGHFYDGEKSVNYCADKIRYVPGGMEFDCIMDGSRMDNLFIPTYGEHNVSDAILAIAACHKLGFTETEIRNGLSQYTKPKGRLNVAELNQGIVIIDDSFNANPNSVKAALDVLEIIAKGPAVAILGGMEGLGLYSLEGHEEIGQYVSQKPVDKLYTFESKAELIGAAAVRAGFPGANVVHCPSKNELYSHLKNLEPLTTILVKGSRKLRMNEIVNYIKVKYQMR